MNENWTKYIELLLQGELSPEDTIKLQTELDRNPEMRQSLEKQKRIHQAAKRSGERTMIKNIRKTYLMKRAIKTSIVSVLAATLIATAAYFLMKDSGGKKTKAQTEMAVSEEAEVGKYDNYDDKAEIDNLPIHYFEHDGKDATFMSPKGILISVPKKTFLLDGKPYKGKAIVQFQEAFEAADIVKAGLSTTSGNRVLETQGMFGLKAFTPDGKELKINDDDGIYLQVPVDENRAGMELFKGVKNENGDIDWQNPQPIEKMPTQANMLDLDLFPQGYEDKLDKLKWHKNKKQRDSLYLSFDQNQIETQPKNVNVKIPNNLSEIRKFDAVTEPIFITSTDASSKKFNLVRERGSYRITSNPSQIKDYKAFLIQSGAKSNQYPQMFVQDLAHKRVELTVAFLPKSIPAKIITEDNEIPDPGNVIISAPMTSIEDPFRFKSDNRNVKINYVETKINRDNAMAYYVSTYKLDLRNTKKKDFSLKTDLRTDIIQGPLNSFNIRFVKNDAVADTTSTNPFLPPSKVLAIWKKKFNGTILATRDFEKRMVAIHGACNEKVFDVYVNQINKPLWQLDEQVVKMGYSNFKVFAAERIGKLEQTNAHMSTLRQFYQSNVSRLKAMAKKDRNLQKAIEISWDRNVGKSRNQEVNRTYKRVQKVYQEEYNLNLNNVLDQLGRKKTVGVTIRGNSHGSKRVNRASNKPQAFDNRNTSNIYNIDKFTRIMTSTRTSGEFKDKETGKTAKLSYKKMTATIQNPGEYKRLFMYLLPKQLNSFIRVNPTRGKFDYSLNQDISYDAVFVGINDKGYFLAKQNDLKSGDLGKIVLEKISEDEFDSTIEKMNRKRSKTAKSISSELNWLKTERRNYKVQLQRKKMVEFRNSVRGVVFPCSSGEYYFYQEAEKADQANPFF